MADESAGAIRDSLPPKSIRAGLALVTVGVGLAAFDLVVDAVVTVRLLTHTLDGSKLTELSVYAGLRFIIYLAAIPTALALARRVRRRDNQARTRLLILLCFFALGNAPNFFVSEFQLLGAAMGGEPGRPLELWLNYTALGSMFIDVVLLLLALTSAVLLALGGRWTKPAADRP